MDEVKKTNQKYMELNPLQFEDFKTGNLTIKMPEELET